MIRLLMLVVLAACAGQEGDRCNPQEANQTCADGLKCLAPENCPKLITFCCPMDRASSSSSCNACPPPDLGGD